eukprot:924788-Karenia_brevis.AAC.1
MLDFVRGHDRTGTTITKWMKPALYLTPASDSVLEYVAADSQGLPKYDNLVGTAFMQLEGLQSKGYWWQLSLYRDQC